MKAFQRAAALLLMLSLLPLPARAAFTDVPESHWAYETVQKAADYKLVSGNSDGSFGVGQPVTRAQFAKMLCMLMDWELAVPEQGSFEDNQDKSQWYYPYIETAYAHGALLKLNESCEPNEPLPREEMAAMTVRALGYATLSGIVQDDCPFSDATTNRGYIALAYHMGIIGGIGEGRFAPQTAAKREQAAAVLVRAYERMRGSLSERTVLHGEGEAAPENAVWAELISNTDASIPMHPRAALESVYDAAIQAGKEGAVVLHTAPWAVPVRGNMASQGQAISAEELQRYLADSKTRTYRSARYESSYLINGRTAVWYESEEDIAVKVRLCRMLGVSDVYLAP